MKAKNKFDSELCGSLPVHRINLIQPYGYLIVLDKNTLQVIQCSENIEELTGINSRDFIQQSFQKFIRKNDTEAILNLNHSVDEDLPLSISLSFSGKSMPCMALIHTGDNYHILEIELTRGTDKAFLDVYQRIRYSMAAINKETEIDKACAAVVSEMKEISRYQSVLMYRFDDDWNGTVIAELNDKGKDEFMGLKFPASDIPSQVRNLYLINPYRYIPNRDYEPIRLYPVINPVDQSLINMSLCNLRSVASVHLEYMKNMNVAASMSIRVIVNEQLWGLISCHHPVAKQLSYQQRSIFELLSGIISSKITAIINRESFAATQELNNVRLMLINHIYEGNDWRGNILYQKTNVAQLLKSNGVAIIYDGRIDTVGEVPANDDLENLVYWLQAKNVDKLMVVNNLPELNDEAARYADLASGIIVLPINAEKGDYIIGFRPEIIRTVSWGGNPNEAIQFEDDGKKYHPRNSFKKWIEIVRHTSKAWNQEEINNAESFRAHLIEHLLKLSV